MKVSIIRVKAQDTLNIIIDLIKNALNSRVFLIVSEGNDILYSEVGLETLFKKSLELGKELIISVPSDRAYELANKLGLVVTKDQDVFSIDYQLWQKAHEILANYKAHALYSNDIKLPKTSEQTDTSKPEVIKQAHEKKDLTGLDFSGAVVTEKKQPAKKGVVKSTKKINLTSPTGKVLKQVKKKRVNVKMVILAIFATLIALLGLSFWVFYRFFTKVYIQFTIPKDVVSKTYEVTGELGVEGVDAMHKKFELKSYENEKEGSLTEKATQKQKDGTYATGVINVTNSDTNPIEISVGQVFVNGDKEFKATSAYTISPGATEAVSVQAVDYGDSYNLAPNQTFTIKDLTASYTATNPTAFSGGSLREFTVVSEKEVKKVADKLKKQLLEQAKVGIEDVYKDEDYVLIKSSVKDITDKKEKYKVTPNIGEEATEFTVTTKVKIRALYYHQPSLESLIQELIINDYKKEKKLSDNIVVKLDDFKYSIEKVKVIDSQHVKFTVKVSASVVPQTHFEDLKQKILGLDFVEAQNIIEKEYSTLILKYDMVYIPEWMPKFLQKIPKEDSRIIVVVNYSTKEQKAE